MLYGLQYLACPQTFCLQTKSMLQAHWTVLEHVLFVQMYSRLLTNHSWLTESRQRWLSLGFKCLLFFSLHFCTSSTLTLTAVSRNRSSLLSELESVIIGNTTFSAWMKCDWLLSWWLHLDLCQGGGQRSVVFHFVCNPQIQSMADHSLSPTGVARKCGLDLDWSLNKCVVRMYTEQCWYLCVSKLILCRSIQTLSSPHHMDCW